MGFRFRRSIKLIPGLRLNLGLRGASLSAGVPGAMINFSRRGARSTFGIPGTGFSWSPSSRSGSLPPRYRQPVQPGESRPINSVAELEEAIRDPRAKVVYRGSGRRLSPQQLEAAYRKLANEERKEQAQAEVDKMAADLAEQLNCWREMPNLPSMEDYRAALKVQPFVYAPKPPVAPNLANARADLDIQTRLEVDGATPPVATTAPILLATGGVMGGLLLALLGGATGTVAASEGVPAAGYASAGLILLSVALGGVAVVAAAGLHWLRRSRRTAAVDTEAARQSEAAWPERERALLDGHAAAVAAFQRDRGAAEAEWLEAERARIVWASRLMAGDVEAIEGSVTDSLQDLDFPFETQAAFGVENAQDGYLHLDLPEIEDVVPTTRQRVLGDGRLKDVKRDESERNAEYGELVCGVGLMMAAASFAAAPTLSVVQIAAYTQREQKGKAKGQIDDDYVYVASIPRTLFDGFDAKSVKATSLLMRTARMEQQANFRLKKLPTKEIPGWVREFQD